MWSHLRTPRAQASRHSACLLAGHAPLTSFITKQATVSHSPSPALALQSSPTCRLVVLRLLNSCSEGRLVALAAELLKALQEWPAKQRRVSQLVRSTDGAAGSPRSSASRQANKQMARHQSRAPRTPRHSPLPSPPAGACSQSTGTQRCRKTCSVEGTGVPARGSSRHAGMQPKHQSTLLRVSGASPALCSMHDWGRTLAGACSRGPPHRMGMEVGRGGSASGGKDWSRCGSSVLAGHQG